MYAQTCTRPDISFVVRMLGRYQSNLGLDHWRAAKKVLKYLQETKDHTLSYRRSDHLYFFSVKVNTSHRSTGRVGST